MMRFLFLIFHLIISLAICAQNNDCINAEGLKNGIKANFATTIGMSSEAGEITNPSLLCSSDESTVWYRYTALETELINISFNNTNIPLDAIPSISIIDKCLDGFVLFKNNNFGSFDAICLQSGETIFIQVATCAEESGEFELTLNSSKYSVETSPFEDLCNEGGSHNLVDHEITTEVGSWSVKPNSVDISNEIFDAKNADIGTYTLTYTIDNQIAYCPTFSQQTITVLQPKYAGIPNETTLCIDENIIVQLSDLLDSPDVGGSWSSTISNGFNPMNGTFDLTGQTTGSYAFTYSFENTFPCPQTSATVIINTWELPTANAGENKSIDCVNSFTLLNGELSSSGNSFTYQWLGPDKKPINGATSPSYKATSKGTYTLIVTSIQTGCYARDSVLVFSSENKPHFEIDSTPPSCYGESDGSIKLINTVGGSGNYKYKINNNTYKDSPFFEQLPAGNYILYTKDSNDCETAIPFRLDGPAELKVSISSSSPTVNHGDLKTLNFSTSTDIATSSIIWTENDIEICDSEVIFCNSLEVEILESSTFCVIITDKNGCVAKDCIDIKVIKPNKIYIPNVFNPELSGEQSHFFISDDQSIANITEFKIYSRWGDLIFETENIKPNASNYKDGWDGTFKGNYVEPGVYVYLINVLYYDYQQQEFVGNITVVR